MASAVSGGRARADRFAAGKPFSRYVLTYGRVQIGEAASFLYNLIDQLNDLMDLYRETYSTW